MNGIVSLLDAHHYSHVEALWGELAARFGLRGVYVTPYPHFSYQVAPQYDWERLEPRLKRAAARLKPFTVRSSGLGVFTGAQPVLYVPLARSPSLQAAHRVIWEEVTPAATAPLPYYEADQWMPHITIGFGDVDAETLGQIVRLLGERDFSWEISVDNLAFIHNTGAQQVLRWQLPLGGVE